MSSPPVPAAHSSPAVAGAPAAAPSPASRSRMLRGWAAPAPAAPAVPIAIAVAGVVGAVALPWAVVGLGWLVTAVGITAATVVAVATRSRAAATLAPGSQPAPIAPGGAGVRAAWAVLALLLVGVGAVRAAGWLFALCLLAALGCGLLAATGARRGFVRVALAVPIAGLRSLPWLARARVAGSVARTTATVALTAALLIVFGSLFAGADAAFGHLLSIVVPAFDGATAARWGFAFVVVAPVTATACFLAVAPPPVDGGAAEPRRWRRVDWALPVGALVVLFTGFVVVQATVLFGGDDHVLHTANLTYAEYARSGFWQLLAVTLLTLGVIAVAARKAARATTEDRAYLRGLLGALSGLTLVVVASALSRMWTYEQAYGFTRSRVLVSACELWLGSVFLLVLVAGVRLRATWLPRAVVASAALALLGLAVLNPDRFIADQNVIRYQDTGSIDVDYLTQLSADAAPALDRLPEPLRSCTLRRIVSDLQVDVEQRHGWIGWNLARVRAQPIVAGYVVPARDACPATFRDHNGR